MSMKQEIETWVSALQHYDNNEFEDSINIFQPIADTSKILFNCGVIKATLGEHEAAVRYYQRATALDQYLAIAYFQQGVSNFLVGDFEEALANFNDTLLYLRGNKWIDYAQLGLKFKLYSCEVLFNRGLCYIYLTATEAGMQDLAFAAKEKDVSDHDVIDEAIKEKAEGYTVFSIPVGVVFRPNEAKVKNIQTRDYLGKARLVAQSVDASGHRRKLSNDVWARDDRPPERVSYAATNLVKSNLSSRTRQQSEPPVHRNVFPPTPPPEAEKPANARSSREQQTSTAASKQSVREDSAHSNTSSNGESPVKAAPRSCSATRQKPERLELGTAAFERPPPVDQYRRGAPRSMSERPSSDRRRERDRERERQGREREIPRERERESTSSAKAPRERSDAHGQLPSGYMPSRERGMFGVVDDIETRSSLSPPDGHAGGRERGRSGSLTQGTAPAKTVSRHSGAARQDHIEEEEEEEFEASPIEPSTQQQHHLSSTSRFDDARFSSTSTGTHRAPRRGSSRQPPPSLRKIRVKVHFGEDTRYVMTAADVSFGELVDAITRKFALKTRIKVRTKDEEGDLITMGDQEDLDMAVGVCREGAAREAADMGKMEIWVQEI